jgi:hypothetical protein
MAERRKGILEVAQEEADKFLSDDNEPEEEPE